MPIARLLVRPQLVFTAVFRPIVAGLNNFSNWVLARFGIILKRNFRELAPQKNCLLVRRSAEMGTLDTRTATFVDRTLKFSARTAADVMTPRMDMETIEADQTLDEVLTLPDAPAFRFRLPMVTPMKFGDIAHQKAIAVPKSKRGQLTAGAIAGDVVRVPEAVNLDTLSLNYVKPHFRWPWSSMNTGVLQEW